MEWDIYRVSKMPGPGEHEIPRMMEALTWRGGQFNQGKPKTDIEWSIYRAKQIPGPGNYSTESILRKGGLKGERFNLGNAKSHVEWEIHRASQVRPATSLRRPKTIRHGKDSHGTSTI